MDYIEYKGNRFSVEKVSSWYNASYDKYYVSLTEIGSEQVCLPETYNGKAIETWIAKNKDIQLLKNFDRVRYLYISGSISKIDIDNDIFPSLEQVEIDPSNKNFYTEGRMIITKGENELLYCPVCKGMSLRIPESVRCICDDAFWGTKYEEIIFPKKDLRICRQAFRGSRWLDLQEDVVVIGTMLYKFPDNVDRLVIPEQVRRFHPDVFGMYHCPGELESPVLPPGRDISAMSRSGRCHFLTLTSENAHINMVNLRKWKSLRGVEIAEGHRKYRTSNGVVYSRDGKILVWYPCQKKDDVFEIPDGVRKIGEFAFADQEWLKKVILPKSVSAIGTGAFSGCSRLENVVLPSGIREIPDSGAYQGAGVFANCPNLKSIILPERLTYLGSFAFYQSGLESIELGENLEQIGEYALMAKGLKEIRLPSALKRVGKGSLFYVSRIKAYEGTAKGIVAAVNAHWPDTKDSITNMKWSSCRITVLHRKSDKQEYFLLPATLKRSAACHLETAWNGDRIDYDEYDQCLEGIADPEEKIEFAMQGLLRAGKGEDNIYEDYIRRVAYKIGQRLLGQGKEKEFLSFLKRDFLSENALLKLIKYSNEQGEMVCSAYLTETLRKKKNRKSRNAGIRI